MRKNLLLNNLESLTNYKVYSKTNNGFEKVLGNFTLKSFIKSFKNPKKIKKSTFLEEMAVKYPNEDGPSQDSILNKKANKLKEFLFNLNNENIQNVETIKVPEKPKNVLNYKKPLYIDIYPNPCTYNPKYDLIFKRIPITTIYNTPTKIENNNINNSLVKRKIKLKKISKEKNYNNTSYKNNKIKKIKLRNISLINENDEHFSNKNEFYKKENEIIQNLKNKTNTNKYFIKKKLYPHSHDNKYNNKINDIIKKNKTPNNNKINTSIILKDNNISNIHKININRKSITKNCIFKTSIANKSNKVKFPNENKRILDFNKMSKRNFEILLNNSILKNPSFYHYNPKYDYISDTSNVFNFGLNNKTNLEKKKFLLKKMWCSYADLSKDYNIINNSKLKDNIEISK